MRSFPHPTFVTNVFSANFKMSYYVLLVADEKKGCVMMVLFFLP